MSMILLKRGQQADIGSVTLAEGEIAIAYNADKTSAVLYAGTGNGKVLITPEIDLSGVLQDAKNYTDTEINSLVNGAPEAMDTLKELADAIAANDDIMTALQSAIGDKVDKVTGKGLSSEDYTTAEKTKLLGIAANANNYTHPSTHAASMITESTTKRFVSDVEKNTWNAKLGSNDTIDGGTF